MKKISFRIIFPIIAIPLFLFCGIITGGGHGNFMPSFLFFYPVTILLVPFYFIIRNFNAFSPSSLQNILMLLDSIFSLFWFYLVGTVIDLLSGNLAWKKARKFIFIQLPLVFLSLLSLSINIFQNDKLFKNEPHFFEFDFWIVWVSYFFYLIILVFIVFFFNKKKQLSIY